MTLRRPDDLLRSANELLTQALTAAYNRGYAYAKREELHWGAFAEATAEEQAQSERLLSDFVKDLVRDYSAAVDIAATLVAKPQMDDLRMTA